jgi:hypothetical protein
MPVPMTHDCVPSPKVEKAAQVPRSVLTSNWYYATGPARRETRRKVQTGAIGRQKIERGVENESDDEDERKAKDVCRDVMVAEPSREIVSVRRYVHECRVRSCHVEKAGEIVLNNKRGRHVSSRTPVRVGDTELRQ